MWTFSFLLQKWHLRIGRVKDLVAANLNTYCINVLNVHNTMYLVPNLDWPVQATHSTNVLFFQVTWKPWIRLPICKGGIFPKVSWLPVYFSLFFGCNGRCHSFLRIRTLSEKAYHVGKRVLNFFSSLRYLCETFLYCDFLLLQT